MLFDAQWRMVWVSEELKKLIGEEDETKLGYGQHIAKSWGNEAWKGSITGQSQMQVAYDNLPYIAFDTPGGIEAVEKILATSFDLDFESLQLGLVEQAPPPFRHTTIEWVWGDLPPSAINQMFLRLHDLQGALAGHAILYDSYLPARLLALVARGDEGMFERMARLLEPGRRSAAILFADLQASALLARRLSSAAYFQLIREITTNIDDVVIRHQGIVGKHAGDGVTAFFLASNCGSPSGAARAAVEAARQIHTQTLAAAEAVGEEVGVVDPKECLVNVGLHWGSNLYMGQLVTGGRLEVTALGDEVNECARIQQAATEGEALASKLLIEQLTEDDASILQIDPDSTRYRMVSELPGVTSKGVRDAGGIPVAPVNQLT